MLDAAKAMKLSAKDLEKLNIIDEIIKEPVGGAHRDRDAILVSVKDSISKNLSFFKGMSSEDIFNHRKNKFLKIGRDKGFIDNPKSLSAIQSSGVKIQEIFSSKKNILIMAFIIISLILFLGLGL